VTDLRGYHHEAGGGTAIWMLDTLMNVKAGGDETRGGFTLIEALAPSGFGTPLHIHHREEEGFYVLEGSMTVQCGDDRWVAEPESFVLLPRGVPHAYLVNEGPCRMLQVTSPAQFEKFAEEVGRPAESATLPHRLRRTSRSSKRLVLVGESRPPVHRSRASPGGTGEGLATVCLGLLLEERADHGPGRGMTPGHAPNQRAQLRADAHLHRWPDHCRGPVEQLIGMPHRCADPRWLSDVRLSPAPQREAIGRAWS